MKRQILKLDTSNRRLRDEALALEMELCRDGYLLNQIDEINSKSMEFDQNIENKHNCTKPKSPELYQTASVQTVTQILPKCNAENKEAQDMINNEPKAKKDKSEIITKMIQLKREKSILLKESKLLERQLTASEARVAKLEDKNTVL